MRRAPATETVAFDESGESPSLARSNHVDHIVLGELVDEPFIADLDLNCRIFQSEFAQHLCWRDAGLGEMALHRLIGSLRGFLFDQPQLNRLISVRRDSLPLYDHTWAGFDHRNRRYAAVRRKDLSHSQFL